MSKTRVGSAMPDITLKLSHKEYANLIKLAYAGNWLINAIRDPGEEIERFSHIEQKVFETGFENGYDDLLELSEEKDRIFPTRKLEESEIEGYISDYDGNAMWEELIDVLAWRDFDRLYDEKDVLAMTNDEKRDKFLELVDKYGHEFEEHDTDRLEIVT